VHSLEEFVRKVFMGLDLDFEKFVEIDKSLYRPVDLEIIYGDNSKAKKVLGWQYNMRFDDLIDKLVEDEIDYIKWESDERR
jgi:GDPmannose 4,6-dehydratase